MRWNRAYFSQSGDFFDLGKAAPTFMPNDLMSKSGPSMRAPRAQAEKSLKELLAKEGFQPGQRIPTVDILARHCGVARGTLLTALAELEKQGFVENRGHRGRFIPAYASGSALTALVLTDLGDSVRSEEIVDPGWDVWMERSLASCLQRRGILAVQVPAAQIDEETIQRLADIGLLGVLARWSVAESPTGIRALQACRARHLPMVVNHADEAWEGVDRCYSDWERGTRQLVEFLAAQGCRRILRIWPDVLIHSPPAWLRLRDAGYQAATAALGLAALPPIHIPPVQRAPGDAGAFEAVVRRLAGYLVDRLLRADAPDALMCTTDIDAIACAAACRLCGREPGRDIRIVGYDNYWRTCGELRFESSLPAATVDKTNDEVAEAMVQALLAQKDRKNPVVERVPPRLVIPTR